MLSPIMINIFFIFVSNNSQNYAFFPDYPKSLLLEDLEHEFEGEDCYGDECEEGDLA